MLILTCEWLCFCCYICDELGTETLLKNENCANSFRIGWKSALHDHGKGEGMEGGGGGVRTIQRRVI